MASKTPSCSCSPVWYQVHELRLPPWIGTMHQELEGVMLFCHSDAFTQAAWDIIISSSYAINVRDPKHTWYVRHRR